MNIDTILLLYLCVMETIMFLETKKKKTRRRLPKNVLKLEQSWWNKQ